MKQKSVLFLLLVIGLAVLAGFLYQQKSYQLGLDVSGGVRLTYQLDTDKLTPEQRTRLPEIRKQLIKILTNRVSQSLGVVEGNVLEKGGNQFVVELPGKTDIDKARQVLSTTASIKFYHANTVATPYATYRRYEIGSTEHGTTGNPVVTFHLSSNPEHLIKPGTPEYIDMIKGWDLILQGDELVRAFEQQSGDHYNIVLDFTPEGGRKMEAISRKLFNRHENIAAVLDNRVLSIAPIKEGAVLGAQVVVTGNFTGEQAKALTTLLNGGALPVDLKEVSSQQIDPMIGTHALDQMVYAGFISFGLICLFLLAYYLFPGIVAILALCLYVLFTLTVLKLLGATFSLASIAGFILSVGIAVDANILVFERVKEELRSGNKSLMRCVELGFNRALPAIIDSNVCTIITSAVLAVLGTGAVKGFATTLIIGLVISFFTAVTVTRSLLIFLMGSGLGANPKWFALGRQWFGEGLQDQAEHKPLQIVNNWKKFFAISAISIIPGIVFIFMGGLKPNVEFRGGYEVAYALPNNSPLTAEQIAATLEKNHIEGVNVKISSGTDQEKIAYVTIPNLAEFQTTKGIPQKAVQEKIARAAGFDLSSERSFTKIGPSVQREAIYNAIWSIIIGCLLIVFYLALRFGVALGGLKNGLKFGLSAIGALIHDILFVISAAAIVGYFFSWEISALFITALLTVIGFSVHDSIVIFDRIRENLRKPNRGEDFGNLCNRSITQSFARSINTSFTVVLTLFILLILGTTTPDLRFFVLTMLLGIISGTYSSIYNAAPILYLWDKAIGRKYGEQATLIAEAIREQERARAETMAANKPVDPTQYGYGQTKRRDNPIERSKKHLDE